MLKHLPELRRLPESAQPPSGGCVLKHDEYKDSIELELPAAFRRLCVETSATTNSMPTYSVSCLFVAICSNIAQAGHSSFDPSLSEALVKALEDIRSKL